MSPLGTGAVYWFAVHVIVLCCRSFLCSFSSSSCAGSETKFWPVSRSDSKPGRLRTGGLWLGTYWTKTPFLVRESGILCKGIASSSWTGHVSNLPQGYLQINTTITKTNTIQVIKPTVKRFRDRNNDTSCFLRLCFYSNGGVRPVKILAPNPDITESNFSFLRPFLLSLCWIAFLCHKILNVLIHFIGP